MEELYLSGRARLLGVSNMTLEQIERLYTEAQVRPHLVKTDVMRPRAGIIEHVNFVQPTE